MRKRLGAALHARVTKRLLNAGERPDLQDII
jgi:hypothetical protein